MATTLINPTPLGNSLQELLMCDEFVPGSQPSYQTAKVILTLHPLGRKMAESPIMMAQSQPRTIAIPDGPEDRLKEQYLKQWEADGWDKHISNTMKLARTYGISSMALLCEDVDTNVPLGSDKFKLEDLWKKNISFNIFDPLNTSGSLVLNQDPNDMTFQKTQSISVSGKVYHRSRVVIILNEDPIYIDFTQSSFGFVGRSVFQRALFPLKSFVNTMVTDDMVVLKVGVLVAKLIAPGSIIDNVMAKIGGWKRAILQQARTNQVISIGKDEEIESLNLQNLEAPYGMARKNIIENIATAADMPAKILLQETFAEGFGEGTEDAKYVARFIDRMRIEMQPLYNYADRINQRRAWNPEYYEIIKKDFPDRYKGMSYNEAFYRWSNSYTAVWPSLLKEPPSEEIKVDDVRLRAVIALLEVLLPVVKGSAQATFELVQWAADNFNSLKLLFPNPLELDEDELLPVLEEAVETAKNAQEAASQGGEGEGPKPPRPFADSTSGKALDRAIASLPARLRSHGEAAKRGA